LRILSQTAIGAGVRRLEAQTGLGALDHARSEGAVLRNLSRMLRVPPEEVGSRIQKLLDRQKELERELEAARARMRRGGSSDPMQQIHEVGGVRYVTAEVEEASPKELRTMVDELKQRIGSGVVLLASRHEGKVALALGVTADIASRFPAGRLIKGLAECVGGSGGGRPDFAQAGGSQPENLPRALDLLAPLLAGTGS
jgi:alanyl-tRNA synthetase